MLHIDSLCVSIDETPILKNFSLTVRPGEVHALMGPNGAGKSTLAKVIAGHPAYEVTSGSMTFEGNDLLDLDPDERAKLGLFMGFQYPVEVPGVSNTDFIKAAYKGVHGEALLADQIPPDFADRDLNVGFSGGEKKRNEIIQMEVLRPKLALLDETDSGLDIDAIKIVADGIARHINEERAVVLITHYKRLLDYVKPTHVHVVVDGAITLSGGIEIAEGLEARGYQEHLV